MLTIVEMSELFYAYPVMGQLRPLHQDAIQKESLCFQANTNQLLFQTGDPCRWLFLMTAGSLQVARPTATGHLVKLYHVHPGETCLVTVSALLGNTPYPASGIITANAKGILLSQYIFSQLIADSVPFRTHLFHLCSQRVQELLQHFDSLDMITGQLPDESSFWSRNNLTAPGAESGLSPA